MTGAKFGNWILGDEIGRGPVGVVYKAVAIDGRQAAVKILTHPATRNPDFLHRFPAEMLALQRLNHPNLVRYYECGVAGGTAYYACELIDGRDLATLLKSRPKSATQPGLDWRTEFIRLSVDVIRAIKHGHHRSVLHRNLKPSNVLIRPDGTVKLADFGLTKVINLPPLTLDPDPWGTVGFLAPEHFTGKPQTRRSDLYALGGVLWTALAGRPPFAASSAAEYMHKHCYALPERPANIAPRLPPDLDELICSLLSKDPTRRPTSAAAVLEQLSQFRGKMERKGITVVWPPEPDDGTGLEAALAESGGPTQPEIDQTRPLMSRPWVVGGLLIGVLLALGYGFLRPRPSAEELFAAAQPLLASDNPNDWDRAIDDYLEPLSRRFPDQYIDEVSHAMQHVTLRRGLRRSIGQGEKVKYKSESERWYHYGLKQAQAGDFNGAQKTWELLIRAFDDAPWVDLAKAGLGELTRVPKTQWNQASLTATLERVKTLPDPAARSTASKSLAELYRDDPRATDLIHKMSGP